MISSAADLPPAVAGVDQLLGMAAQEAQHPDTNPASEEDEEHEDGEVHGHQRRPDVLIKLPLNDLVRYPV